MARFQSEYAAADDDGLGGVMQYEQPTDAVTWIALIHQSDGERRTVAIDDFHRWAQPTIRRIAARLLHEMRLDRNTWHDDMESCTAEAMFTLVTEVVEGKMDPRDLGSFTALLTFRAQSKAREFLNSAAGVNQASGQVGLKRRVKEMRWTQQDLVQRTGAVPTAQEVVDATNARMLAKRKDARRQGMICSLDDYAYLDLAPNTPLDLTVEPATRSVDADEASLHSTERANLVAATIKRCYDDSDLLGQVAEHWFAEADRDTYDGPPASDVIAALVGIGASTARSKVALVREYARQVLRDFYGIEHM